MAGSHHRSRSEHYGQFRGLSAADTSSRFYLETTPFSLSLKSLRNFFNFGSMTT
jgi:hypothetical protein